MKTAVERFEEKYMPEPNSGCWLWMGAVYSGGRYGSFWADGSNVSAHTWAYEHFVGPVPEGTELDHLCRVTQCVNPDHLEAVPHRDNSLRGISFSALNAKKTHCKRGHPFSGENLRIMRQKGHIKRGCRICYRGYQKAARERKAALRNRNAPAAVQVR